MHDAQLQAIEDELSKIAGLGDVWRSFTDLFRPDVRKNRAEAAAFVESEDPDKWNSLMDKVKNPQSLGSPRAGARHDSGVHKDLVSPN